MKQLITLLFIGALSTLNAQTINNAFNETLPYNPTECGIAAGPHAIAIVVQTVYRARPDGYHIQFTTSFIGKDVEEVEAKMNKKIDSLIGEVKGLDIPSQNVLAEVTALDPIFQTSISGSGSAEPIGYKITENITFKVRDFKTIRHLAKTCMDFNIYDIVQVKPYILHADKIYDTLADKTVEVLEFKKDLCEKVGHGFVDGAANFYKCKNVIYPSDAYLRSQIRNSRLYMHDINQNSAIDISRTVSVDSYQSLDLQTADYVFHPDILEPVIEFYYRINYNYVIPPSEEELEKKKKEEEEDAPEKIFYILDKDGELKKIEF
jgi:hypothetical protein